jgi:hypothetical protein
MGPLFAAALAAARRTRDRRSSLGRSKTHSRSSRRARDSSKPYPHLMRVRRSRGTPASRSSSNHHPPAPVARSRLHTHRNPIPRAAC